jgi:DNA-binding NarL/FixJ family response regulator
MATSGIISVLVYEDNELLRQSIESMLSFNPQFKLVGSYNNVLKVEEQLKTLQPDIILMDIDMPGRSGIDAVSKIRTGGSNTLILMITVFDDNQHVFDALCAGASGYLLKKHLATKLFDSIDELLAGGAPMSPSIARMVIASMHKKAVQQNPYALTARETDVLTSLSKGNSYKLIANEFGISIDTVRTHIKNVYEKLHVHSQAEAVAKAINEKLI